MLPRETEIGNEISCSLFMADIIVFKISHGENFHYSRRTGDTFNSPGLTTALYI
jgi:hypothetical protein